MRFDVVTLLPEIIDGALSKGVVGQAAKAGLFQVNCINPRKFSKDLHKTVDDRPYGGGDGMVMLAEPLHRGMDEAEAVPVTGARLRVYLSPQGRPFTQETAMAWAAKYEQLVLVCGRYGGVDQRFLNTRIDEEVSLGDFILSGGEIAALGVIDVVARLIPGVLGNDQSAQEESFSHDGLLESPLFTRPAEYDGVKVPAVLTSGNHAAIQKWRRLIGVLRTEKLRPDLFIRAGVTPAELKDARALLQSMSDEERALCGL